MVKIGDVVAHKSRPSVKWVVTNIELPTKGFFGNGLKRPLIHCRRLDDKEQFDTIRFIEEELVLW